MYKHISIVCILFLFACTACEDEPVDGKSKTIIEKQVNVPDFNADSAYAFVKAQVDFGPRVPNSSAHVACAKWLEEKFKSYGANVIVQEPKLKSWDGKTLNAKNIIAEFNPQARKRVVLAAHWDTRPYADKDSLKSNWNKPIDGANDGGSGVGVLLELARMMKNFPPTIGIDLILFDAEDSGKPEYEQQDYTTMEPELAQQVSHSDGLTWCLGSQYWGANPHRTNYTAKYGILLDMVGSADAVFNKEGQSMYYAPNIVSKVWRAAGKLGYSNYFGDETTPALTDDHLYMNDLAGIPTIDIIHYAQGPKTMGLGNYQFGSYHHTVNDNMSVIDPSTLKAVGQTVAYVIYHEE